MSSGIDSYLGAEYEKSMKTITLIFIIASLVSKTNQPGLAEIFAPDGVSGSDIIENFRQ